MGRNQYWAGRVYDLCVYYMTGTPEGSTESGFMEKQNCHRKDFMIIAVPNDFHNETNHKYCSVLYLFGATEYKIYQYYL